MMTNLKQFITPYKKDTFLPKLPTCPIGSLYDIGCTDDNDVLLAISQLKENNDIVAIDKYGDKIRIYTRLPIPIETILINDGVWQIIQFVPYRNQWVCADYDFIMDCVMRVIKYKKKRIVADVVPDSPTDKQMYYLSSLGYKGASPKTKSDACALIASLIS